MANIYNKESNRTLTAYQKAINDAAQEIFVKNPTMLRALGRFLETARDVVDSTYSFKKGKGRAKEYACTTSDASSICKRSKIGSGLHENRMKEVEEELKNVGERIKYKEKRRI